MNAQNRFRIVAAITAAGASSRMGSPKALMEWEQGTALSTIVATLERAGLSAPLVILGAHAEVVGAEARRVGAPTAVNPDWERGRFSSVRVAAEWAQSEDAALLLWPVDCPGVSANTVSALIRRSQEEPQANLVPCHEGRSGHPVLLSMATVQAIASAGDDGNLRDFVHGGGRIMVEVDDPAVMENINRPADHAAASPAKVVKP